MLLAFGGAAWLLLRGDSLRRWLLFWLAGTFIGLTLAGEKMPWLETHITLPLASKNPITMRRNISRIADLIAREGRSGQDQAVGGRAHFFAACCLARIMPLPDAIGSAKSWYAAFCGYTGAG